ncbi:hypothetical protein [Microbacterium sp. 77mftsu3.1]|uniref:hypothetical protein n=1 Tax=Microbacterium sp. 77mftsu3.1 TaxID=1761802 RepID=UPI000364BFC1|nr:hypothetical protein [Microbacterium sp. 77mftsu3.1]SDH53859.1 hypothetical protein SAMN04488590_3514 [Microbacterium sp. 77mftsu3.1]
MAELSPALAADLAYAVSRWGLRVEDVPRDHEGKTISDRLEMLVDAGESFCGSAFTRLDLRTDGKVVWELFPENPATLQAQADTIDEASELMGKEQAHREAASTSVVRRSMLPTAEHVTAMQALLAFIDGEDGTVPEANEELWSDATLFEEAAIAVPGLREAEKAVATRAQLIAELSEGRVPPTSAVYVRRALDSEEDGLRNADITLAGHRVSVVRLRDAAQQVLDELLPHYQLAEQIRQARDDLDAIEVAMHWPGDWQSAPRMSSADAAVRS